MNVFDAVKSRRTVRSFKNESVSREDIVKMIDSARISPSAGNIQSLKYEIIDSPEERKVIFPYVKYAGYIAHWNPKFEETPAAFIAVLNDTDIRKTNSFTECDAGIAMMAISLVAVEMGYDSCILGAIDRKKLAKILGINHDILYLIGIGKSNQKNTMYDDSDNVKYEMDEGHNFKVPKRKLEDIIVSWNKGRLNNDGILFKE